MHTTIAELVEKIKAKTFTPEENLRLLINAKILDEEGNYNKDYFDLEEDNNLKSVSPKE